MKISFLALLLAVFAVQTGLAQSIEQPSEKQRITKFQIGYQLGGTPRNHYFAYNDGIALSATHGIRLNKRFALSAGLGFERLKEGDLLPLMVDAQWSPRENNNFWDFKMGYSLGWSHRSSVNPDYDYKGGYLFSLGYGTKLMQVKNLGIHFLASYNYRHTRLRYRPEPDGDLFTSNTRIHLVSFSFIVMI